MLSSSHRHFVHHLCQGRAQEAEGTRLSILVCGQLCALRRLTDSTGAVQYAANARRVRLRLTATRIRFPKYED
jgi:hypothetical protein